MWKGVEQRCEDLARRAGLVGVPPSVVAAAVVLLGLAVVVALWRWWPGAAPEGVSAGTVRDVGSRVGTASGTASSSTGPGALKDGKAGSPGAGATVTVHVVGAVVHSGVYVLPTTARVCDAVSAAGGLTGNAAQNAVNLARQLVDGEQIAVPTADEYQAGATGAGAPGAGSTGGDSAGRSGAPAQAPGTPAGGPVNINTADAAALDALPGVGPSTAAKIVADRETNGLFASPDDLGRVAGIGPKKLEALREFICVR